MKDVIYQTGPNQQPVADLHRMLRCRDGVAS